MALARTRTKDLVAMVIVKRELLGYIRAYFDVDWRRIRVVTVFVH
jgi:hypothetical protein